MNRTLKPRLLVSFSGGRTSAWMSKLLKEYYSDQYELVFVFANTGEEHERTLEFVDQCDREFGLKLVWLEAVVTPETRVATTYRIVDFKTAARSGVGGPFEDVIRKYGIPNRNYPHCTRELKLRPIYTYAESIGWKRGEFQCAVGIRADEPKRISPRAVKDGIVYPLADWHPMDKQDVNENWGEQPFDLGIPERNGNCKTCWKKSDAKHFANIDEQPEDYEFNRKMEAKYPTAGSGEGVRVFFRMARSTGQLFAARLAAEGFRVLPQDADADAGCAESCEAFSAEQLELFEAQS